MVQMTRDIKLPDRTRQRLEAESNQQRVQKPHDIRGSIPLVDYTNPAKFPPYVYREYPKMPLLDNNQPIIIDESGGVLVFYDAADEVDFKSMNPDVAEEIERNAPAKAIADTIAAQADEIEQLRAKLLAAGIDAPASVRPKKDAKNPLADVMRPSIPAVPEAVGKAPEGLAAVLPRNGDNKKPGNPLKNKKN
jgi:hypothetical protein